VSTYAISVLIGGFGEFGEFGELSNRVLKQLSDLDPSNRLATIHQLYRQTK